MPQHNSNVTHCKTAVILRHSCLPNEGPCYIFSNAIGSCMWRYVILQSDYLLYFKIPVNGDSLLHFGILLFKLHRATMKFYFEYCDNQQYMLYYVLNVIDSLELKIRRIILKFKNINFRLFNLVIVAFMVQNIV